MAKPLLMLDIDGVLAPFGVAAENPETHYEHVIGGPIWGDLSIWLRHDLEEIVQRLIKTFSLMWATGWGGKEANEHLLGPMGLEDALHAIDYNASVPGVSRVAGALRFSGEIETWKLPWIKQFLDEDERPAIWIDDEILDDARVYAEERTSRGMPTLFIQTDPALGFLDEHIELLEEWADEHQ